MEYTIDRVAESHVFFTATSLVQQIIRDIQRSLMMTLPMTDPSWYAIYGLPFTINKNPSFVSIYTIRLDPMGYR